MLTGDAGYDGEARLGDAPPPPPPPPPPGPPVIGDAEGGIKDATVIAVIDTGLNPYHWDFLASRMPQHANGDAGDDLPLGHRADEWLPGFPAASAFASFDRLDLTLEETDGTQSTDDLRNADAEKWATVQQSTPEEMHAYWFPGTKVIGAMTFRGDGGILGPNDAHGAGTTSSAVGNLHGTCPECLLFYIELPSELGPDHPIAEAAADWAMSQPWIDAVSNSYGFSLTDPVRTRVYDGANTTLQREATERGQAVLYSAGNGVENAFTVPNPTLFSSQEGPDWILTVGAVSPGDDPAYEPILADTGDHRDGAYIGAGKPADVAGVGSDYPTAYYADTVGGTGSIGFGGTSNATPQVAGLYGRALHVARTSLTGASRTQSGGVVAMGAPFACAAARSDCELADGRLTAPELRTRLFHGAIPSIAGAAVSGLGLVTDYKLPPVGEETLMGEGHGAYLGRSHATPGTWLTEFDRIVAPMQGRSATLQRPDGEREWMTVDSYCRQQAWGSWALGYYVEGSTTLPGDDTAYPVRSLLERTCPGGPLL